MNENAKTETALMEATFTLPDMVSSGEFTNEELAQDAAGLRLVFPRVKIPAGGGLHFEIPGDDPENPESTKTLVGVILTTHAANAYWPDGNSEDENATPICSSNDGCTGIGAPGGVCSTCRLNAYGTGENGKGKACKNMRQLYLLREGDYMPLQLALPPTSLAPFNTFMNAAFFYQRRGVCGSIVEIGLKRIDNGVNVYSVATFKKVADFSGEMLAVVKRYAAGFREQLNAVFEERNAQAEARPDAMEQYDVQGYDMAQGYAEEPVEDLPFDVPANAVAINGDLDQLPA